MISHSVEREATDLCTSVRSVQSREGWILISGVPCLAHSSSFPVELNNDDNNGKSSGVLERPFSNER